MKLSATISRVQASNGMISFSGPDGAGSEIEPDHLNILEAARPTLERVLLAHYAIQGDITQAAGKTITLTFGNEAIGLTIGGW